MIVIFGRRYVGGPRSRDDEETPLRVATLAPNRRRQITKDTLAMAHVGWRGFVERAMGIENTAPEPLII